MILSLFDYANNPRSRFCQKARAAYLYQRWAYYNSLPCIK